jgi:hypothetical protein
MHIKSVQKNVLTGTPLEVNGYVPSGLRNAEKRLDRHSVARHLLSSGSRRLIQEMVGVGGNPRFISECANIKRSTTFIAMEGG